MLKIVEALYVLYHQYDHLAYALRQVNIFDREWQLYHRSTPQCRCREPLAFQTCRSNMYGLSGCQRDNL